VSFLRLVRVGGVAALVALLFNVSQAMTIAREGRTAPGIGWAVAVVTLLFLVRAIVTEKSRGPEANFEKDTLWGVAAGGVAALFSAFHG